jgi:spermidine/putrescine transport system permease protein
MAPRMNQPDKKSVDLYAMTWRLPIIVWQTIFFVGPLVFMVAMSFFVVKNYRMVEAFEFTNWERCWAAAISGTAIC